MSTSSGAYGQAPEDFQRLSDRLDPLILTTQMQNLFVAVLPGAGGRKGSFYINHRVQGVDRVASQDLLSILA